MHYYLGYLYNILLFLFIMDTTNEIKHEKFFVNYKICSATFLCLIKRLPNLVLEWEGKINSFATRGDCVI